MVRNTVRSSACLALLCVLLTTFAQAAPPVVLKLWLNGAPEPAGFSPGVEHITPPRDGAQTRLMNVAEPTISVYTPEQPNGTAVVVAPGGAYSFLAIEHEGTRVCERLTPLGITCVLLRYRVPSRSATEPDKEAMQDAQRAMGMLRLRASELGIRRDRIGFLGFSAGGHLALRMALNANERSYAFDHALDVADVTPDFVAPIYPAYLIDPQKPGELRPGLKVTPRAPPICLIHANDDAGWSTAAGSAMIYLEYKKLGLPAELHIYAKGGHGFGLKPLQGPTSEWLLRVTEWMGAMGWIKP